jgi:hypothetical protein
MFFSVKKASLLLYFVIYTEKSVFNVSERVLVARAPLGAKDALPIFDKI